MKNKKKPIIGLIAVIISIIYIYGCDLSLFEDNDDKILESSLNMVFNKTKQLNKGDSLVFRMDTVTHFKWDKMYAFNHIDDKKAIEEKLGFDWDTNFLDIGEYDNLFVFVKKEEVVSYVFFSATGENHEQRFSINVDRCKYYTPQTAVFRILKVWSSDHPEWYGLWMNVIPSVRCVPLDIPPDVRKFYQLQKKG